MNPKTLKVLAVLTIVFGGLAVLISSLGSPSSAADSETGPLFPDLDVNAVAEIHVVGADDEFLVKKVDGVWTMPDKGQFPIQFDKVKTVAMAFKNFELIEEKTSNPDLYAKLGVEDPSEEEATSKKVTLKDANGNVMASLVLGNTKAQRARVGEGAMYVRRPEEGPSLEVRGTVFVDATATNWLDKKITQIPGDRVARATVTHPDGEVLVLTKEKPEDTEFEVADIPEGRELTWEGAGTPVGGALNYLNMADVKRAADVELDESTGTTLRFEFWDGLVVDARTHTSEELEDQAYLTLEASFDESLRELGREIPLGPMPAEDPAAEEAEDDRKSVEDVRAEIVAFNDKHREWIYVLPSYTASNFRKRLEELLKAEVEEDVESPDDLMPAFPGLGPGTDEGPGEGGAGLEGSGLEGALESLLDDPESLLDPETKTEDDPAGSGGDPVQDPESTEDPPAENPPVGDPPAEDPASSDPGSSDPGTSDPGSSDPGGSDPGGGR